MTMSVPERNSGSEGKEEESEDESEILEESPCGRWQKRKEQVGLRLCVFGSMNGLSFLIYDTMDVIRGLSDQILFIILCHWSL